MNDASEISRRLRDRADALLVELFPLGKFERAEFRVGDLGGSAGRSLVVTLHGPKAGLWYDHAAAVGGDLLDLVARARFDGAIGKAMKWSREWLRCPAPAPERREAERRAPPSPAETRQRVRRLWNEALPLSRGDPVDCYLRGRGIELEQIGRAPASLRFHPRCWCRETDSRMPAMVAAVLNCNDELVAVHRTYLHELDGRVVKAPLAQSAKLSFGHYAGGAIRLSRGISGLPWRLAPSTDLLALGEGIEDCLTALIAVPTLRVACAVSLSAMLSLRVPPNVRKILLLTQNDPPTSPAAATLDKVRRRFREAGMQLWRARPDALYKDLNAALQEQSRSVRPRRDDELALR